MMPENDFQLKFTLRQHTPLIHFQHDQAGATLRTTEVKAKLDRFLVEKVFQNDFEACKKHLIGFSEKDEKQLKERFEKQGFRALNFKLQIQPKEVRLTEIGFVNQSRNRGVFWEKSFPGFFANMGEENQKEPKWFSFTPKSIECAINSFDIDLVKTLRASKSHFATFFLRNNFGTRQGKGFGSFTLENFNKESANFRLADSTRKFSVPLKNSVNMEWTDQFTEKQYSAERLQWLINQQNLFNHIDLFYRTLRGGINIPNKLYFKSLMFHYAKKDDWQWDKKTLRLHFYHDHPNFQRVVRERTEPNGTVVFSPSREDRDSFDFRDLLGFSTQQKWKEYSEDTLTKKGKSKNGDEIERMKSPLIFKPIGNSSGGFDVYILPQTIEPDYLGAAITTESSKFSIKGNKVLMIPSIFSTKDYLDWAARFWKTKTVTDERFFAEYDDRRSPPEISIINRIYQELFEQLP